MTDIHSIPTKADELQAALEAIKRALPIYIELASINASVRREHYLAYIEHGFTEQQALVLCQKMEL